MTNPTVSVVNSYAKPEWKLAQMSSTTRLSFDVAIVGAGPAGIAAAAAASECGLSVAVIDDNPGLGGQIWRGEDGSSGHSAATDWFQRFTNSSAKWIKSARVFHAANGNLYAESSDSMYQVRYQTLILATGARERFLPFVGWTLPNVVGAGALQALIKCGLQVKGKRIVVAGTGPLLLAIAACASKKGAEVICICEQTTRSKWLRFGFSAVFGLGRARDAFGFLWQLRGIPLWTDSWPVAAFGTDCVEGVRLRKKGRLQQISCDFLAVGFHLVPNVELAQLMGCVLKNGFVAVDENRRTSLPGVYCVGEATGIGGFERSIIEGQIAGYAAANRNDWARKLYRQHAGHERYSRALKKSFELREELKAMASDKTLFCRCEDITLATVREHKSWRAAKLHTRCGMGPCQGRVCGAAAEFLFGWNVESVRPPLFPVQCSNLAAMAGTVISQGVQEDQR